MKNATKTLLATLAGAFLICSAANSQRPSVMISGGISFGGTYTTDTGDVNTANAFTSFPIVFVVSTSKDYSSVPLFTPVTQNSFSFDPFTPPVSPLWTFMNAGLTYSFVLNTCFISVQGNNALVLMGNGTLNITGFAPKSGTWVFTANQAGGTFSFSSSNGALRQR